jgi:phosphoglycerate dehydrogenase-like enzyme
MKVVVTRRLPDSVEARLAQRFEEAWLINAARGGPVDRWFRA